MADKSEIDTSNKCFVGVHGDNLTIMRPPQGLISKPDALLLAAWLVALADDDGQFPAVLEAVQNC